MSKRSILFFSILLIYSCNNRQENIANEKAIPQDTLAPLKVTMLADLPDSLQPKTIVLEKMSMPLTIMVPYKSGGSYSITNSNGEVRIINLEPPINKPLSVLQNEKGEPILDAEGKTFTMGEGGKSNFTIFNTDNGLALDIINSTVEDKLGNLWFATQGGGVSRYDGKTFTNFSTAQGLVNNVVLSIIIDQKGNLWFGTQGAGVSKYDGKSFTNFSTAQGLANNNVTSMLEDKTGNLWFGTQGAGVSKYDGKTFTNISKAQGLANNNVTSMLEDKTGNLWFGTQGGGISRYDPSASLRTGSPSFTNFSTAQGLANSNVASISEDRTGNLWFGTRGGGVSRYDGKTFTNFSTAQGLAGNTVASILEDKAGNLWFGTWGGGVSRYDPSASLRTGYPSFTNFSTAQGLANNAVRSIIEDKAGNLWFGTWGGGASRYNGKSFTNFSTIHGLANNDVRSIFKDQTGSLWFGTGGGGVSRYDGENFTNFSTSQGLAGNTVASILEDKAGNLWFGTRGGGVSRYNGKSFTNFSTDQGLAGNTVASILEDKAGNLWFGINGGGVSKYDGKTFTNFSTAQGLANNVVLSILEDQYGNLWFGTDGGGVSRFDGETFTNFSTAQGLANNFIYSIFEDQSRNLWFGTSEGLSVMGVQEVKILEEKKGKKIILEKLFKSFKIADGLPDNFVTQVMQMPNGKIAVGTNLGITLFNLSEGGSKLTEIEIFNSTTGYPVKDVNVGQNGMYLDNKGIIWAGTGSEKTGLVRFDYAALHKYKAPPTLVIQSIKVKDEDICWSNLKTKGIRKNLEDSTTALLHEFFAYGRTLSTSENDSILIRFGNIQFDGISKFYPLPQNLVLPYEYNQIAFEFAAIETGKPFLVKYQYMLEGYDKDWSPVTSKNNANFNNISEGTYTFKLKGQGSNGVWTEPVTYIFKILPPWYRTWWAYTLYIVFFLTLILLIIKIYTRRLIAQKEYLEQVVQKRTAEVILQKEEIKTSLELVNQQKEVIEESHEQITASINYAKRIQNAVLPNDEFVIMLFPNHFIFFRPRDIVSGDFYFVKQIKKYTLIAAGDCTGHGVPGAFMSMLGVAILNDITQRVDVNSSDAILNLLRSQLKQSLQQTGKLGEQQDGMDIAFCVIDTDTMEMSFSGAYNPCWIFRTAATIPASETPPEFIHLPADRMPVGVFIKEKDFTNQTFQLQKGDVFYLFSDGYNSQFGGENNHKYNTKRFRQFLQRICQKPMDEQKELLELDFNTWKGANEQTDDVLVVGVRI